MTPKLRDLCQRTLDLRLPWSTDCWSAGEVIAGGGSEPRITPSLDLIHQVEETDPSKGLLKGCHQLGVAHPWDVLAFQ